MCAGAGTYYSRFAALITMGSNMLALEVIVGYLCEASQCIQVQIVEMQDSQIADFDVLNVCIASDNVEPQFIVQVTAGDVCRHVCSVHFTLKMKLLRLAEKNHFSKLYTLKCCLAHRNVLPVVIGYVRVCMYSQPIPTKCNMYNDLLCCGVYIK